MSEQQHKEVIRGAEAEQLIANPVFREVIEAMEADIGKSMINVVTTDHESCADLIREMQLLEMMKSKFVQFAQTGSVSKKMLQEVEDEKAREDKVVELRR